MSQGSNCECMYLCFIFVACDVLYSDGMVLFPSSYVLCVLDLKVLLYSTSLPQASTAFSFSLQ